MYKILRIVKVNEITMQININTATLLRENNIERFNIFKSYKHF